MHRRYGANWPSGRKGTHTHTHTHPRARERTRVRTRAYARTPTRTCTRKGKRTHSCTHGRSTHGRTHERTRPFIFRFPNTATSSLLLELTCSRFLRRDVFGRGARSFSAQGGRRKIKLKECHCGRSKLPICLAHATSPNQRCRRISWRPECPRALRSPPQPEFQNTTRFQHGEKLAIHIPPVILPCVFLGPRRCKWDDGAAKISVSLRWGPNRRRAPVAAVFVGEAAQQLLLALQVHDVPDIIFQERYLHFERAIDAQDPRPT